MDSAVVTPAFALAKIQPPQPRGRLVERRLLERSLGRSLAQNPLTLLVAPAGYGKTAALTRQIRQLSAACALAWISVDEDDPLPRFLACLAAALEPHDLPWRVAPEALPMLARAGRGLGEVAGEVVNALAAAEVERGLLVVDDAHRVTDPQVFELLGRMLEHWPPRWGLVVASRVEPPLPLARLRAAGELGEFGQRQLRFSPEDVAGLMAEAGVEASPDEVRTLLRRTHGWAAGLRLSLSAGPAAGGRRLAAQTQRHLFDYLATEVFDDMPPELRDFLLRCSVLPELTAARCAHVSGDAQAAHRLDELERRSLFVSVLDAEETTLRLHDLFRDFLEDRLKRDHPEWVPQLLRRAAEHEPDLSRAVGFLARAGAWHEAAAMLAARGPALLMQGGGAELVQMLGQFPPGEAGRPELQMLRGLEAFTRYDWDELLPAMQRAADGHGRAGREREAAMAQAYVCAGWHHAGRQAEAGEALARLRALDLDDEARAVILYVSAWDAFAAERSEDVVALMAAMLESLERMPDLRRWHPYANLSLFAGLPGIAPLMQRFVDDVLRLGGSEPTQLRAAVWHVRCCQALGAGRLDEAWAWLQRADEDCRWLGQPRMLMTDNALAHVLLHALRGEADACRHAGQVALQDVQLNSAPSHRRVHESDVLVAQSRAAWVLGDADTVRALDRDLQAVAHPWEWLGALRCRNYSRAFVAQLDGRLDEAARLLEPIAADVERHRYFSSTQARFMLADVRLQLGQRDGAAALLGRTLERALADGEIGGALLAGPAVLGRLAAVDWRGRLAPQAVTLLQSLPAALRGTPPAVVQPAPDSARVQRPADDALALLSEREREVLERLAAGDSNKLIARAFELSPHTVKRHVANILDKLAVQTRGQAAARWRDAGPMA